MKRPAAAGLLAFMAIASPLSSMALPPAPLPKAKAKGKAKGKAKAKVKAKAKAKAKAKVKARALPPPALPPPPSSSESDPVTEPEGLGTPEVPLTPALTDDLIPVGVPKTPAPISPDGWLKVRHTTPYGVMIFCFYPNEPFHIWVAPRTKIIVHPQWCENLCKLHHWVNFCPYVIVPKTMGSHVFYLQVNDTWWQIELDATIFPTCCWCVNMATGDHRENYWPTNPF